MIELSTKRLRRSAEIDKIFGRLAMRKVRILDGDRIMLKKVKQHGRNR
jgi:translation initiation factor IF-1